MSLNTNATENWDEEVKTNLTEHLKKESPYQLSDTVQLKTEYKSFDSMSVEVEGYRLEIPDALIRGIYNFGWENPSGIQSKGIMPILCGLDIIAQAQAGTGKTGTYMIGGLSRIDPDLKEIQLMVLCNTKELADQVFTFANNVSVNMGLEIYLAMGGTQVSKDREALNRGVQVLIGTPGRIADLCLKKSANLEYLRTLVIDESDELLSEGFKDTIYSICSNLPKRNCNIAIISATMPKEIVELCDSFLTNPVKILSKNELYIPEGITQFYVKNLKDDTWKTETLCHIYDKINGAQIIIYVNTVKKCEMLVSELGKKEIVATYIHGKMDLAVRKDIVNKFRKGFYKVIITTDLLARGLDIPSLKLVINYEMPAKENLNTYVHRIGRSGRFGKKGFAINLVNNTEELIVDEIKRIYKCKIDALPKNFDKLI